MNIYRYTIGKITREVYKLEEVPEGVSYIVVEQQEVEVDPIEEIKSFLAQKENDGANYFNDINAKITLELIGVERVALFSILEEIDTILYPPLMKIKTGDFASALLLFNRQTPPTNAMLLQYYNEAKQYALEYYNMKYPK